MYAIYRVKEGDTLDSVASNYGVTVDELANINGGVSDYVIKPGDYIVVPNKTAENMYFKRYVIQNGDTIYDIARRLNVSPSSLLRLNGLENEDIIYPNDTIFVPKEGTMFYITGMDETLNDVSRRMNVSPNDLASQNGTIYLTNDQLIVYKN